METFLHLSKVFSCSKHCIKQSYSFARPCVWPNTLRMLPCIMHGPLTPCKFENTWKVSSCHPNFHSLWWITKAKQFFAMERDFSIMRKSGASEIDTKIMMLPSYLTQQGICKGKKKKIQNQVTVILRHTETPGQEFSSPLQKTHPVWNHIQLCTKLKHGNENLGFQFWLISDQ